MLAGGHVSVVATVLGVVIVAIITQALVLFHIDPFFVQVVLGRSDPVGGRAQPMARGAPRHRSQGCPAMTGFALEARGISKGFPGVQALQDVSLQARQGLDPCAARRERRRQIDADQDHHRRPPARRGRAAARRRTPSFLSPRDAIAAGIGVVHQERNLIPRFSVGENIMLEQLGGASAAADRLRDGPRRRHGAGSTCSGSTSTRARRSRSSTSRRCSWSRSPRRCRCARASCCSTSRRPR